MNGVLLGFEIATGIALFVLIFFVVIPRMSLPFRAFWYKRANAEKMPTEVRRYLMKKGIEKLKRDKKLPPEFQAKIATQIYAAALDDKDGIFEGMHGDMIKGALTLLGSIPLEQCATCKRPIFTHEATKVGEEYFCEKCGQVRTAI